MDHRTIRTTLTRRLSEFPVKIPKNGDFSESLVRYLVDAIENREFSITAVMGLPEPYRTHALLYVNGDKPYTGTGPSIQCVLRNTGREPVTLKVGFERHAFTLRDSSKVTYNQVDIVRLLKPGETITLPSSATVNALWKYCPEAHFDGVSSVSGGNAAIRSDSLEEIGWTSTYQGRTIASRESPEANPSKEGSPKKL